jgi:hypothetical protein
MNNNTENKIKSIDHFDTDISLFHLIPCGNGRSLEYLKLIRDSILNSTVDTGLKPISVLVTGIQGKRTYARCLLRGIGIESIQEISGKMLHDCRNLEELFSLSYYSRGYIISDTDCMGYAPQRELIRVLREGYFNVYNSLKRTSEKYPMCGPIVLTTYNIKRLLPEITEQINHIVNLGEYTTDQRKAILIQRIRACNAQFEHEESLKKLADNIKSLNHLVQILKIVLSAMLAEGRNILTMQDIEKGLSYI